MSLSEPGANASTDLEEWKLKCRALVGELDANESRWRNERTDLHKTLLRLCFAYSGMDPTLDAQLKKLQTELKRNPDSANREQLINAIADRIARLGEQQPPSDLSAFPGELLVSLIDELDLPGEHATELKLIRSRLGRTEVETAPQNAANLAALINEALAQSNLATKGAARDSFVEFLSKLNVPDPLGEKFASLHHRSTEIKTDLERLAVIDDTIALLREGLSQDAAPASSAVQTREIVQELIEWMTLPSQVKDQLFAIQTKLDDTANSGELSAILRDLGHTVSRFHGNLMSELTDVEYYLKNTAIRLKELQLGIEEAFDDQRESVAEHQHLDAGIEDKVVTIAARLAQENDLETIKQLIDQGLKDIRARMRDHLKRDQQRLSLGEKRVQALTDRLKKMGSESARLRAQVKRERDRAQRDALTGIANRAAYDERISAEVARHRRHGRQVSLAVIDIDKFKDVNDRLGHKAGDKVLKNVAEICASSIRESDFIARYGGEEFVLVLPETSADQAYVVAEKLRQEIAGKGFFYNEERVPVTVSIGVSELSPKHNPDQFFLRADRALYLAKEGGRNRSVIAPESH